MGFKIGDRVRIKADCADRYIQPWRGRFKAGRQGTVILEPSANIMGYKVRWDHTRAKYPSDWEIVHWQDDLELVT